MNRVFMTVAAFATVLPIAAAAPPAIGEKELTRSMLASEVTSRNARPSSCRVSGSFVDRLTAGHEAIFAPGAARSGWYFE